MHYCTLISIISAIGIQPAYGKGITHFQLGIFGHATSYHYRYGNFFMPSKHLCGHVNNILFWGDSFHNYRHNTSIWIDRSLTYQYRESFPLIYQHLYCPWKYSMSVFKRHRIQGIVLWVPIGTTSDFCIYSNLFGMFSHTIVHSRKKDNHKKRK